MPSSEQLNAVYRGVCQEVAGILGSQTFEDWKKDEPLHVGDLIIFNNSFLYREGLTGTTKSKKYLCVTLDSDGEPAVLQVEGRINSTFKRIPGRQVGKHRMTDLRTAITDEMGRLGTIVFSLVGRIGDDQPASVALPSGTGFAALHYQPDQRTVAEISDTSVLVNRLDDIDVVWQAIARLLAELDVGNSAELAECFEKSFSDLRETAGRPIDLEDIRLDAPSILSEVVAGVTEQVSAYTSALTAHREDPDDTEALNEVMRIAYNFADGAKALIALVTGLSDLKPLLSWLTISAQCELAERFGDLPFSLVGKAKPSLEKYRSLVAGARNRAFHDLFAFGRPFRVPLKSDAFQAAALHLFREYKRGGPALEFKDRELVELLQGFTRAAERPVPLGFWEKDLAVMEAVQHVASAFHRALVLVAPVLDEQNSTT
jgi:hypothetical protein